MPGGSTWKALAEQLGVSLSTLREMRGEESSPGDIRDLEPWQAYMHKRSQRSNKGLAGSDPRDANGDRPAWAAVLPNGAGGKYLDAIIQGMPPSTAAKLEEVEARQLATRKQQLEIDHLEGRMVDTEQHLAALRHLVEIVLDTIASPPEVLTSGMPADLRRPFARDWKTWNHDVRNALAEAVQR